MALSVKLYREFGLHYSRTLSDDLQLAEEVSLHTSDCLSLPSAASESTFTASLTCTCRMRWVPPLRQ